MRPFIYFCCSILIYSLPAGGVHDHPGADWEDEGAEPSTHGEEQRWRWSRRQQNHPADRRSQGKSLFSGTNLLLHFIFSSMFGISADERDEELRATHHSDSYKSSNVTQIKNLVVLTWKYLFRTKRLMPGWCLVRWSLTIDLQNVQIAPLLDPQIFGVWD